MNKLIKIVCAGAIGVAVFGIGGAADHFLYPKDPHMVNIKDIKAFALHPDFAYINVDKDHDGRADFTARYNVTGFAADGVYLEYNAYRAK